MQRIRTYYKHKFRNSEFNAAFDAVENAFKEFVAAFDYVGIAVGAAAAEHSPQNLTVDLSSPAVVYDQVGNQIRWASIQNVDLSVDEDSVATLPLGDDEKWVSIFVAFKKTYADPREDGNGDDVFLEENDSYEIHVVQAAEAATGAGARPPLRGDEILVADVLLTNGITAIADSDIHTDRSEVIFALTGSPTEVRQRKLSDVLQAFLDLLNGFSGGTVPVAGITDAPLSLSSGTVLAVFTELLAHVNDVAAHQNRANVFTAGQVVDTDAADVPLIKTTKVPGDDPEATNKWKELARFPTGDNGVTIRLYAGSLNTLGHFALTLNASWDPAALEWSQEYATYPSQMLRSTLGATTGSFGNYYMEPGATAGVDPWQKTPTAGSGQFGNYYAGGHYKYSPTRSVRYIVPISWADGDEGGWALDGSGNWVSTGVNKVLRLGLRIPYGCTLQAIDVLILATDGGNPSTVYLQKRSGISWSTPTAPTTSNENSDTTSGTGLQNVNVGASGETNIDTETTFYDAVVNSGAVGDTVYAVGVTILDPGPRND